MAYPTSPQDPLELLDKLPEKFEEARKSGQLFFFPSEAKDIYNSGKKFNIRLCPALQDKAKAKSDALAAVKAEREDGSPDKKRPRTTSSAKRDVKVPEDKQNAQEPFKPPYVPELFVGSLKGIDGEEGMSILLNKYAVLPNHFLLCPPSYQPQDLPPTPPQLASAYSLLLAASRNPSNPANLLAFYNGGPGAGASQTWRHIQFVNVSNGRAPVEDWVQNVTFERLDKAVIVPDLPYLHVVHPLPPAGSLPFPLTEEAEEHLVDTLALALMKLLDMAFDAARRGGGRKDGGWNLLLTLNHIHLIPRTLPSYPLPSPHQPLELNSLGYAGLVLVRSQEEEAALMAAAEAEGGGLMGVLGRCGVARETGEKVLEDEAVFQGQVDAGLI
ncbi:hypothetical protein IAR50_003604 [Cryptococcus sp. DSM 104548]